MKDRMKQWLCPLTAVVLGTLGSFLRRMLYAGGVDELGLLPVWHPLEVALWILTAGAGIVLGFLAIRQQDVPRGPGVLYGFGTLAAAGAMLAVSLTPFTEPRKGLELLEHLSANFAGVALLLTVVAQAARRYEIRIRGIGFGIASLALAAHLIARYQLWRSNPQMQDIAFSLLACIVLMLFAYYQTAWSAGMSCRKQLTATGLGGLYLCLVALSGTEQPLFYVCGALWCACSLWPKAPEVTA